MMKTTKRSAKMLIAALLALTLTLVPLFATAETIYLGKLTSDCSLYNSDLKEVESLDKGDYVLVKTTASSKVLAAMSTTGHKGYVYTGYVKNLGSFDTDTIGITSGKTNVYRIKNGEPYVYTVLEGKWPLRVLNVKNGVAQVEAMNGEKGYVRVSELKHF